MRPRVALASVGTATPAHRVDQEQAKSFARGFFADSFREIDRLLTAFDHTGINARQLARPLTWYRSPHSFAEKNDVYREVALALAETAARQALQRAELASREVAGLVFVSSTGVCAPSLDVPLIDALGVRRTAVRVPLWGLGCAGGAAGLARATELVHALGGPVLLVAAEVCSATFMHGDRSKSNLIAAALFGDGAAAAVLRSEDEGLALLGGSSLLLEDSEDVMGWTLEDGGLRVRFARSIPGIVNDVVPSFRTQAATSVGLQAADLRHFVLHPGGAKVLAAYEDALGVAPSRLQSARTVLRDHGNMSSPTVLFVLERFLRTTARDGEAGLVLGLGPGFSAEGVVVRW